jgi:DNA-binding GntR family transcriptional regulator
MSLNLRAVDLRAASSAADVIFDALREAIVEGTLKDGELLRQDQIATMFNVSRIPVREALARLEEQGLITNQRYKGAVVSSLSLDEISEMFEFRALLEGEIIRQAVDVISDETLAKAKDYANQFARVTDSNLWGNLNRQFHYTLYKDCKKPYHLQIISTRLIMSAVIYARSLCLLQALNARARSMRAF